MHFCNYETKALKVYDITQNMHLSSSMDLVIIAQVPFAIVDRKALTCNRHPYVHAIHNGIFAVMKQKTLKVDDITKNTHLSSSMDLVTIAQVPSAIADRKFLAFIRDRYAHAIHNGIFAIMEQKHKTMASTTMSLVAQKKTENCHARP